MCLIVEKKHFVGLFTGVCRFFSRKLGVPARNSKLFSIHFSSTIVAESSVVGWMVLDFLESGNIYLRAQLSFLFLSLDFISSFYYYRSRRFS